VDREEPESATSELTAAKNPLLTLMRSLVFIILAISVVGLAPPAVAADPKPNIVFILADDLGIGDLGCYNRDSKIPTPHLDRFASQGIRFTDSHSPSAVCTPTRYGLLTGRYAWRTSLKRGVLQGYDPLLIEKDRLTVAAFLKQHGYKTAAIGKWHLGLGGAKPVDYSASLSPGPCSVGFDYFFGIPASLDMEPYVFVEDERVLEAPTNHIAASKHRREGGGGFWRAGPIAPSFRHENVLPAITDKVVEHISRQQRDEPFFLYFALTSPHTPWMPAGGFAGKSQIGYYGDFVMQTDAAIGRLLAALDDAHLADNTLVIITSDNGSHWPPADITKWNHRSNHIYRGQKADLWEGGHRVPFLARWPGKIPAAATSNEPICHTDFLATVATILDAKLPDNAAEDSYNILPALRGERGESPIREAIVHHSGDGAFAIRQGPWKLCLALGSQGFSIPKNIEATEGGPRGQLYNLADDPAEQHNLWSERQEIVRQLTKLLDQYKRDGRSVPHRN
jgi:arylsulfatase A-like enzyme